MTTAVSNYIYDIIPLKVLDTKSVIVEGSNGRKILQVTGIFQKADEPNQNNRIYPHDVLKESVNEIQDRIKRRAVKCEWDHPADAKLHLDRISHLITKLWMEGKNVYGVAEVLEDMPCGKMFATLLKNKVEVGISSRGVGEMETVTEGQNEYYKVLSGYSLVAFDVVSDPSVKQAILSVMESKRSNIKPKIVTRAQRAIINPQQEMLRELNKWLSQDR